MIVMVGTGSSDVWKLPPEWDEASIRLCQALADQRIRQHSGEVLFSCVETVDGWHAKDTQDNRTLYGRYRWSAFKT
jgi:hypothetical protein